MSAKLSLGLAFSLISQALQQGQTLAGIYQVPIERGWMRYYSWWRSCVYSFQANHVVRLKVVYLKKVSINGKGPKQRKGMRTGANQESTPLVGYTAIKETKRKGDCFHKSWRPDLRGQTWAWHQIKLMNGSKGVRYILALLHTPKKIGKAERPLNIWKVLLWSRTIQDTKAMDLTHSISLVRVARLLSSKVPRYTRAFASEVFPQMKDSSIIVENE